MQQHPAAKPLAVWHEAACALVIRELLLQRARQSGVDPEPISDAEGRRETEDEAAIRTLIEREVLVPEPDDDTCWRYYERNRYRFHSSDIYEASHILFAAVADAVRFENDTKHSAYDRNYANRFWRVLVSTQEVLSRFRTGFLGK